MQPYRVEGMLPGVGIGGSLKIRSDGPLTQNIAFKYVMASEPDSYN